MASDHHLPSKIPTYKPNIPDDLFEQIFKRLPVKTLIRLTSVSKSWKSLISSPLFAAVQLNFAASEPPRFVLRAERSDSSPQTPPQIDFIDVVHGVVCVAYKWSNYYVNSTSTAAATLWNPSIRKHVDVPWPTDSSDNRVIGFGFDGSKNDFKVLTISISTTIGQKIPNHYRYKVFSVRGGVWRNPLTHHHPSLVDLRMPILRNHVSCYVNKNIHWVTASMYNSGACYSLLSFDCEWEEFKTMDLPQRVSSVRDSFGDPQVWRTYDGLLSVLKFMSWRNCELWAMERYGVANSWRKRLWLGEIVRSYRLSFAFNETMLLWDVEAAREVTLGRLHFSGWKIDLRD